MKITAANVYVVPTGHRKGVLLELETDSGMTGIGEAGVGYGMGTEAAAEMVATMLSWIVLGRDPAPVELLWNDIYDRGFWTKGGGAISTAGLSAIDHALWDIKGKVLDVPVHTLFGGPFHDTLDVYANGWWFGCDTGTDFAEAGKRIVDRGVRGLKLYPLGIADDVTVIRHPTRRRVDPDVADLAVERVEKLREAVGPGVAILLDFGGGLTNDQALPLLRRLEPFGIGFVEEPADPAIPEVLARMAGAGIPIAAGERVYTRYGFHRLLETAAIDVVQPDVCNVGGLAEARKIAALAEIYNASVAPHNYGTALATAVSAQLSASIANFMVLECFPDHDREAGYLEVIDRPVEATLEAGKVRVPDGPGLGVSLRRDNLELHLWKRVEA